MFERFTDRARRVVVYAQEEALLLGHPHIGTEHLLLGLVTDPDGIAAQVLEPFGVTHEGARAEVEALLGRSERPTHGRLPFTPRAKKVMELSLRETLQLGHDDIGSEHLLLGLLREGEGVAIEILQRLGADVEQIRARVLERIGVPDDQLQVGRRPRRRRSAATLPRCPSCRADLREALAAQEIRVEGEDAALRAIFCRRCGRTITVLPTEGGGA